MTTANDLVEETLAHLFSGQSPIGNRLSGDITSAATTFSCTYPLDSITRGAIVSIGLEDIRIWDTAGLAVTSCERGVNGTTGAAHTSGDYVEVRPKFSRFRVLRAINEDLLDLTSPSNGLFQVKTVDITYNPAIQGYDLAGVTNVVNLLELRWKQPGPSKSWPLITKYALVRNMATTEFASGMAVFLYEPAYPGLSIRVRYSADFSALAALTDDVQSVTGLPTSANDLPPIGAAIRLVAPREINRNFTENQYDPHRLEEIPPGAVLNSTRGLQLLRQQRILAEQSRLASDWPQYT